MKSMKSQQDTVYVTTFRKERYAVVFKLSNGIVQVSFADNSKLVYQSESRMLYQDRNGEKTVYTLQEMNQSEKRDLKKRYKFMKSVIANIHRKRAQKDNF